MPSTSRPAASSRIRATRPAPTAGRRPGKELRHDDLERRGTLRNFLLFNGASGQIARRAWNKAAGPPDQIEGKNLPDARAIKQAVTIPVICTGGFQTASVIARRSSAATAMR